MYNFKAYGKTFKGIAGECMFYLTRFNVYLTNFHKYEYVFKKYEERLSINQKQFIIDNWFSFDAIEFGKDIVIYEVKTRNAEHHNSKYPLKITRNCMNIYAEAETLGFKVKVAIVLLRHNWNYSVFIDNFSYMKENFWVYTHNKHDKSTGYAK